MPRRSWIALLSWVVACSYDFGGGSGAGGAGTSASDVSSSRADASTQEASSASSAARSASSSDSASTSARASSSSGEPPLQPCRLTEPPGGAFVETFDDPDAAERWQQEKGSGNGSAAPNASGQMVIDLGNNDHVFSASKREIFFVDCYVVVEQVAGTEQAIELVALRVADDDDTAFVLRYVSNAPSDPEAQGLVIVDGMQVGELQRETTPRRKLLRLETTGTEIRGMVGDDGVTWEPIYAGERLPWMDAPMRLVLGVRRVDEGPTGVSTFDNVNTL